MAKLPELDRRAKHTVISLIATCFLSVGCKDEKQPPALVDKPTVDETSPNKNGTTPRSGAFSIDEIRVSASQNVFLAEGLPTDKELKACIEKQLLASPAFEKTGRPVTGTITYDYQGKDDAFMIALYGQFSEKGSDPVSAEIGTRLKSGDPLAAGKDARAVALIVCERFSEKIAAQFEVSTADDARLIELANETRDPDALINVVQEIRERDLAAGIPVLMKNLEHSDSRVAVAAAAGLSRLKHDEARGGVLKLAERLSRERDPQYVPILHILADFGGDEVREYLETVAQSHDADAVRQIASEALKRLETKN